MLITLGIERVNDSEWIPLFPDSLLAQFVFSRFSTKNDLTLTDLEVSNVSIDKKSFFWSAVDLRNSLKQFPLEASL